MTGTELLQAALAILGKDTTETADYAVSALIHINAVIAELFDINNSIRTANDAAVLASIPTLATIGGTLTYEAMLTRIVLLPIQL